MWMNLLDLSEITKKHLIMTNSEQIKVYTELKERYLREQNSAMFNYCVTKIELLKITKNPRPYQHRL